MNKYILLFTVFCSGLAIAQNRAFDHLEHLYDQGHYKKVNRKANTLINNPEYDYSSVPKYYEAVSTFQLMIANKGKFANDKHFKGAVENFKQFLAEDANKKVQIAHKEELAFLRRDLKNWLDQNRENNYKNVRENVKFLLTNFFNTNLTIPEEIEKPTETITENTTETNSTSNNASIGNKVVKYAKKYLGTKYKWAGTTPSGFDCSGYTGYVMKKFEKQLPRRAHDQYVKSKKKKLKNVQAGDLVFFGSKKSITHVGIIVSNEKNEPVMIHASTSSGVIITNINKSTYWQKKVVGYGSFL